MKAKTIQAGEGESIEVYGVRRKLLGHYTEDGGPYCRLLFEGGKVYWFAVPYGKGNEAPTGEPPHSVIEAPDGNGDMLTYSDGKTYRTGGALIPFSAEDAAFLHIMKTEHAELDPARAGGALLPGWRLNKLTLKACPNRRKPGVFKYGILSYTVPGGKAWDAVCTLIRANAFDGHGVKMKTPNEHFKREHRSFFTERLAKNESGWFIKTL